MAITADELKEYYGKRFYYFAGLHFFTISCFAVIDLFPEHKEWEFPPNPKDHRTITDLCFGEEEHSLIQQYKAALFARPSLQAARRRQEMVHGIHQDLLHFIKNGRNLIKEIDIHIHKSLKPLSEYCLHQAILYGWLAELDELKTINAVARIDYLGQLVDRRISELLGYWSAKMEEKRRSVKGTLPRIKKNSEMRNL